MNKLEVGQEVRILPQRRHRHVPEGGYAGHVIKVGRRYATAAYTITYVSLGEERHSKQMVEFDMETGEERGAGYYGDRVLTPEQVERDVRYAKAMATLKGAGLELRVGKRELSPELAEALAAVVETFGQEG